MTAFNLFYPQLLPHAPGAPDPLLDQALLDSAQEFCRDTTIWRQQLDDITVRAGVGTYDLPLPAKTRSVLILSAKSGSGWLRPMRTASLPDSNIGWRESQANRALYFVSDDPSTITLVPVPSEREVRAITHLWVALAPANNATELPTILYDDFLQAIAYGARMFLHRLPKRDQYDWVDPSSALYYEELFRRAKGEAKIRAVKNFQSGPIYARSGRLAGAP